MAGQVIGFVGVGRMGGPMSGRLMDAGYELVAFDTQAAAMRPLGERGATLGASPRDVADKADLVLVSLPKPEVVKAVALGEDGLIHGGRAKTVIDLSTTGPSTAALVAGELAAKGIAWVD